MNSRMHSIGESFGRRRPGTWELDARERGRPRSSRTRRTRRRRETIDEEERRVHSFIHSSVPFRFVIDFDFDFDRTIGRLDDVSERRRVNRAEGGGGGARESEDVVEGTRGWSERVKGGDGERTRVDGTDAGGDGGTIRRERTRSVV
jgi:hypothetical protein